MDTREAILNRRVNELLYHYESQEYDKRHPETMLGDRLWWEAFGERYIRKSDVRLKILDIGTGTGLVPLCLQRYLKDPFCFICYDISEGMLKEARNRLKESSSFCFIKGDAAVLPFSSEVFDIVIFNSLLHHLLNYKQFLRECNRVLKRDGIIAFAHEPNREFLKSRLCRILSTLYNLIFPINITKELQKKVNAELTKERLIEKDLSREEIRRLVEFHSPMEQSRLKVDSSKGFIADELLMDDFIGYNVLESSEYSTYFHRPFFEKAKLMSLAVRSMRKFIFKRGNLFRMVLQK